MKCENHKDQEGCRRLHPGRTRIVGMHAAGQYSPKVIKGLERYTGNVGALTRESLASFKLLQIAAWTVSCSELPQSQRKEQNQLGYVRSMCRVCMGASIRSGVEEELQNKRNASKGGLRMISQLRFRRGLDESRRLRLGLLSKEVLRRKMIRLKTSEGRRAWRRADRADFASCDQCVQCAGLGIEQKSCPNSKENTWSD